MLARRNFSFRVSMENTTVSVTSIQRGKVSTPHLAAMFCASHFASNMFRLVLLRWRLSVIHGSRCPLLVRTASAQRLIRICRSHGRLGRLLVVGRVFGCRQLVSLGFRFRWTGNVGACYGDVFRCRVRDIGRLGRRE